jgi:hypothetical protein
MGMPLTTPRQTLLPLYISRNSSASYLALISSSQYDSRTPSCALYSSHVCCITTALSHTRSISISSSMAGSMTFAATRTSRQLRATSNLFRHSDSTSSRCQTSLVVLTLISTKRHRRITLSGILCDPNGHAFRVRVISLLCASVRTQVCRCECCSMHKEKSIL